MTGKRPLDLKGVDLAPYQGRWIALVKGRVAGVGFTQEQAILAARRNRPKEEPVTVIFVSSEFLQEGDDR